MLSSRKVQNGPENLGRRDTIEREHQGEKAILGQTRWKPERDPLYSGTLEIPASGMHVYENVYDAVKREVLEETGLRVTSFYPDMRTKIYAPNDDACFAFAPFCCQQQLKGGLPRVGFVSLCQVEDAESVPQHEAVRDIRWMNVSELQKRFEDTPEKEGVPELLISYQMDRPNS